MIISKKSKTLVTIPQSNPGAFFEEHRDEVTAAMTRVMDSGWYILGSEVASFERRFAQMFGLGGAVGVGSGTDALIIALRALGVGPGDLVATVSHTAVATVAAIEQVGALPVLVDIASDTYNMDPESLDRTLSVRRPRPIKAVIPVHLYGNPANIPVLLQIARQYGACVIEDCAQSHGAMLGDSYTGSMADAATFSFYPTKNLGALGDGGMMTSRDPGCIERARMVREYGWKQRYISEFSGMNTRLDELQAAILLVRLKYLKSGNERRAAIAAAYSESLADTGLKLPITKMGGTHVYHQYVVQHPDRDRLQARLKENGIATNIHYPVPVHRQPAYAGRVEVDPDGLKNTEDVATQILSLPIFPELSDIAVSTVVDAIRSLI